MMAAPYRLPDWFINAVVVIVFAAAIVADHYPRLNVPMGILAFVLAFGSAGYQLYLTAKETSNGSTEP